jgi:pentatricopeptide repeat protein
MADNEIPLDIKSYNDLIDYLCRKRNPSAALKAVIKFQEHGFHPTTQTFQPIVLSFMNQNYDERMRNTLYNLMKDNNVSFPNFNVRG